MTEELQAKIWDILDMVRTKQLPVNVAHASILKIMEEYKQPENKKYGTEDLTKEIMGSHLFRMLQEKYGWMHNILADKADEFTKVEYPNGSDQPSIVSKHFFNFIRKRKPNEENSRNKPATTEQIAGTYANKFAKGNNESG